MDYDAFSPYVRAAMHSELPPFFKIGTRAIFDFEIILLTKGSWKLTIGGKEYICKENDVLLLKPGISHSIEVLDETVSQPHVHFDVVYDKDSHRTPVSFKDISAMSADERELIRTDVLSNLPSPYLKISDIDYFKRLLYDVIDAFSSKKPLYNMECKQKMLTLLSYVIRQNVSSLSHPSETINIITLIRDFIDKNYCNEITLTSLENQFFYNKFYISKEFTKAYGTSVIEYYKNLRIAYAKRCLLNNMTVTEVSESLNMSSIYAFSRFFKEKTGISPQEFKRNSIKNKKI